MQRLAIPILCAVFFCSGAGALVFESLWFRQAGLAFGNSVWASALVLSSFMAGLAVGNVLVVRAAERIRRPVRVYASLEATVAVSGALLVWALPQLGRWLDPLLSAAAFAPWLLNALRLTTSFVLLLVPATAMGATLPILVKALSERDPNFGAVLGRLYGYNTLGAVLGALAAEICLVTWFGVRGAALAASLLYASAALVALAVQRALTDAAEPAPARAVPRRNGAGRASWRAAALAGSSFVAGWVLLAYEMVWFRLLRLFVEPTPLTFSLLLAVVLSGIGLGGFFAGWILGRRPGAHHHAAALACLAGATAIAVYAGFDRILEPYGTSVIQRVAGVLWLATALTWPVSVLSGALFTFTGAALEREVATGVRAAGLLALANTVGGMLGSLAGGFLLLPLLGIERSFFLLASLYGLAGALLLSARPSGPTRLRNGLRAALSVSLAVALLAFPFGAMREDYLSIAATRYGYPKIASIAAVREGLTDTVMLLRTEQRVETAYHRLVTGGFSMASNQVLDRRYMKLFVYWGLALNPRARDALLISYGIGSTAKALSDSAGLRRIDVVDIARDVLETSEIVFPDASPLRDPRVEVIVEDGRYFLETTPRRYDLITSEPPPPRHAGVVSLYTREYFQLVHDRLADGGINTYWLPVHTLQLADTKAIIRGYCEAFPNCSLWAGVGYCWMLAGIRTPVRAVTEEEYSRQWRDPKVAAELRTLGVELPEQLAALFMLDAEGLERLTRGVPPLTDDRPNRLSNATLTQADFAAYLELMDVREAKQSFRKSALVSQLLPEAVRERTLPYFEFQAMIEGGIVLARGRRPLDERLADIHRIQTATPLRTLVLWHLGRRGDERPFRPLETADRALAERDYAKAVLLYAKALKFAPEDPEIPVKAVYAVCMSGAAERAGFSLAQCGKLPTLLVEPSTPPGG